MLNAYFVMMLNQSGTRFIPLLDEDDNLMQFEDERDARDAGWEHAQHGFEIFAALSGEFTYP